MNHLWTLLKTTFNAWNDHEAPRLGAALAFYAVLSLAPLVILAIAILGLFFSQGAARDELLTQVRNITGFQTAEAVRAMIEHGQKSGSGAVGSIIGLITLLFGASGIFGELHSALNKMENVNADTQGLGATIRDRIFSFGMVLAAGFLLLLSMMASSAMEALGRSSQGLPLPAFALQTMDVAISFGVATALFALIFRYVPAKRLAWRTVWIGGAMTALLFTIGKFLIGLYLGKAAVGSAYGAAGSLVAVTVWVYYSSMIFLFGAEFTYVLASGAPRDRPA
ncbi:MAG TPA: YihY/virulence factor BrkB family protein [Bryobacteraceae bacterium]|jgi:membrane protein